MQIIIQPSKDAYATTRIDVEFFRATPVVIGWDLIVIMGNHSHTRKFNLEENARQAAFVILNTGMTAREIVEFMR